MKQTAMQMAIDHYKKLSEQGSNQAYVVAKFLEENFLAMEKEQHDKTAEEWWKEGAHYMESGGRAKWESFEQYYNETFIVP